MGIYFGNDTVNDLYVGLTPVTKGYVGTQLFYNGENTIIDTAYEKYILNTQFSTLYNTAEKPIKSAILKGNTKYRDIDTGDILDAFDETKNLELVSVQMPVLTTTGKNLFHGEIERGSYHPSATTKVDSDKTRCRSSIAPLIPDGFKGIATISEGFQFYLRLFKNGKVVKESGFSTFYTLDNTSNTFSEVTIVIRKVDNTEITDDELATIKIQFEQGSIATSYEPYQSNILTVNEDVELRGIDDVQDTLDCLTGEVTERIGEVVLDGSEKWTKYGGYNLDGYFSFVASIPSLNNLYKKNMSFISADFAMASWSYYVNNKGAEVVWNHDSDKIGIRVKSEKASNVTEIKEFLSTNNIRISYKLATESVKTVDLSIVDKDGNNTELSTFNDITHVTLSSEGLIPEAELEVATKNEEDLNTLSLEMDGISTSQNTLEETVNTQSENVDSTMIATTEIYEQLL